MNTWNESKPIGDAGEVLVQQWFARQGWSVKRRIGEAPHDLSVIGTIEVKHDLLAPTSGNAAVEVSYRGQPSGIMTSRATLWVIVVGDVGYFVRRPTLRSLAERATTVPAGDDKAALVALVPVATLRDTPGVKVVDLTGPD